MDYVKEKQLDELGDKLCQEYREVIVDFIILDDSNKILTQKRSTNRQLFPGVWEFPGGLLTHDEKLIACIKRNLREECQMQLEQVLDLVHIFTWDDDKDVATAQFLVKATGEYQPRKDMVSDYKFIGQEQLPLLFTDEHDPIFRGAFYAFQYIENNPTIFARILFIDRLITGFFSFLQIQSAAPRVTLDAEKRFSINKARGIVELSKEFLEQYDNYACGNIILHQLYHNYCQNITAYSDVKSIRRLLGNEAMYHVDIVADTHTFIFLAKHYGFTKDDYLRMCFDSIEEYRAQTLEESKLTRLLGTVLTLETCSMQTFSVVLPVFDRETNTIHTLQFNENLQYKEIEVKRTSIKQLEQIFTGTGITIDRYLKVLESITDNYYERS